MGGTKTERLNRPFEPNSMKTQILQLETHDDPISVRDKMGWGQAARVVLMWPAHGRILTRRLDLILLQRHSSAIGAQLALVTGDPDVRYHARRLGLPVFKSLKQAQSSVWRVGRRRPRRVFRQNPRPDLQAMRDIVHPPQPAWFEHPLARRGYYGLTMLALLLIAIVFVPAAQVELTPEIRAQEISFMVTANEGIKSPTLSGEIPAREIDIIVEGRDSITTSRQIIIPESAATGMARFSNLTDQAVYIPSGTILLALDAPGGEVLRFTTTRSGEAAAGAGVTVDIPVRALSPGKAWNLPAGSLRGIEGTLGLRVSVDNPQPIRGGSSRSVPGPGSADYDRLYDALLEKLHLAALDEIYNEKLSGGSPISAGLISERLTSEGPTSGVLLTGAAILSDILEIAYDPPRAEADAIQLPGENLTLTLRLEFKALVVSGEDIQALASAILDANLPETFSPDSNRVEIAHLSNPTPDDEQTTYRWRIRASRTIIANLSDDQASRIIRGLAPEKATQTLEQSFFLETPPQITLYPGWWMRLPLLQERITILTP
jgi:hypothetical protein